MHVQQMTSTHPDACGQANDALVRCIEACFDCAQACTACADACLAEPMVKDLTQCIRLNMDCADVCLAAGTIGSRRPGAGERILQAQIETCAEACRLCAEECGRHAQMEHCLICAEACRRCEQACRDAASSLSPRLQ